MKFRRQHVIGPFIVDFYCVKARLIVEVDGPVHGQRIEADIEKQQYLEGLGLTVLRLSDHDVMSDLANALIKIERAAHIE